MNSKRYLNVSWLPWTTRPNCFPNDAQSWVQFQTTTGRASTTDRAPPAHSCQARNQRRLSGCKISHSPMPTPTNKLVYFERCPRPAKRPTTSHQLAFLDAWSSASAQKDRPQNKTDGVSGVMMTPPTASNGMANANHTAR